MDATPSTSMWPALVVDEVNEKELFEPVPFKNPYPSLADLPTKVITVHPRPFRSPYSLFPWFWSWLDQFYNAGVAILSWRWDGDKSSPNPARRSRNIFLAIDYAKTHGIKYLLIDIVSIDQTLNSKDKMKRIVAFSQLYRTNRVLCAYNDPVNGTLHTMRRPWIHSEMVHLLSNTVGITVLADRYYYHACWVERPVNRIRGLDMDPYFKSPDYDDSFGEGGTAPHIFAHQLSHLGCDGFLPTIFGLMLGKVEMHDISDIRYILPGLGPVLSVAYKKMKKEDYLMTVTLFSRALIKFFFSAVGVAVGNIFGIYKVQFQRYSLRRPDPGPNGQWEGKDIYFDGSRIGSLLAIDGLSPLSRTAFSLAADGERRLFSALGLSEQDWQDYIKFREEYQADGLRVISATRDTSHIKIMTMG